VNRTAFEPMLQRNHNKYHVLPFRARRLPPTHARTTHLSPKIPMARIVIAHNSPQSAMTMLTMKTLIVLCTVLSLTIAQEERLLRRRQLHLGRFEAWPLGRTENIEIVEEVESGSQVYVKSVDPNKGRKSTKADDDDSPYKSSKGDDDDSKSSKGDGGYKPPMEPPVVVPPPMSMSMSMSTRRALETKATEGDCFMGAICENSGEALTVCCEDDASSVIGCSTCGGCKSDAGLPVGCCASNGEFFMPPFNCGDGELCCNVNGNFMCAEAVGGLCPTGEGIEARVN